MAMMITSLYRACHSMRPKAPLVIAFTVSCLLISLNWPWPSHTLRIELNPNRAVRPEEAELLYSGEYLLSADQNPSIEGILDKQRQNIQQELEGHPLLPGLEVREVAELVPELGGKAVSTLLVTSWRFGSTFLGAVLNAHPATFYNYEPLHDFGVRQVRSGEDAELAVNRVRKLLHCDYSGMGRFLSYASWYSQFMLAENRRLWWVCIAFKSFCKSPEFMTAFCRLFPFNLAKMTRLRMALTEPLLEDQGLSVKVILLVRDPRGTLQSRQPWDWCQEEADCIDPSRLCQDMVSDYHAALQLQKKFPGRILVIRFDDLSPNQFNVTRDIYEFLSFDFSTPVQQYIHEHTKSNKNANPFNTFRDSKEIHLQWRKKLSFKEVAAIQSHCRDAMLLYGYRIATEADDLATFDPVDKFNFSSYDVFG